MQIDTFFYKFGLTNNEKNIYLFLLGNGPVIASIIGKRLNIKRVTAYASLNSLIDKGLVISFEKNKVFHFEAVNPEEILDMCSKKADEAMDLQENAKSILPALKKVEEKSSDKIYLIVKFNIRDFGGRPERTIVFWAE